MAIADIDGDEAPDLLVDNINDGTLSIYQNVSTPGGFSFGSPREVPAGRKPWCVGTGDFNGDDKTDIAVTNYQDSTVTIFINRTVKDPYSFRVDLQNAGTLRTGMNPLHIEVNDLDGDGNPDIVVACRVSNTLSLFRNVSDAVNVPAAVILVAPEDDATVGKDSVHFFWSPASSGALRYKWLLATDSLFSSSVIDSLLTGTSKVMYALAGGQSYWWKVAAGNAKGWGPFSVTCRFTTLLTDISENQDIPREFGLSQNYPNPFNPTTVVSSQVPVVSHVKLAIYDALGREVAVLVNERRAAGSYHDTFDASGLASGVYVCRMAAGGFVQSRKMLLIK